MELTDRGSKVVGKVSCGFGKWKVEVDENGVVKIGFGYHPGYFEIDLHDASPEEFKRLGDLFYLFYNKTQIYKKEMELSK